MVQVGPPVGADASEPGGVVEEYDEENLATGIEAELGDEFEDIKRPWNPEEIRVKTSSFSLRNILDLLEEGSLDLAPDFQRGKVWKPRQKAQLIESLLLQIPLPAFYFAEDPDGSMRVVDGLQRLSTVREFVREGADSRGGFALRDLEYIDEVEGLRFADLPAPWRRRIFNTQIVVHVIDPATPPGVKYDIFRRINTGGTPLNAQEIRHCMSTARSRAFLKRCVESEAFLSATPYSLHRHARMTDREVVLRFVAFRLLGDVGDYRRFRSMEEMLWATTERLDNPRDLSDDDLDVLFGDLVHALELAEALFGVHAFRKWPMGEDSALKPFNRALFETWMWGLAHADSRELLRRADQIVHEARHRMRNDFEYIDSITTSTGDVRRVEYRFATVREMLGVSVP